MHERLLVFPSGASRSECLGGPRGSLAIPERFCPRGGSCRSVWDRECGLRFGYDPPSIMTADPSVVRKPLNTCGCRRQVIRDPLVQSFTTRVTTETSLRPFSSASQMMQRAELRASPDASSPGRLRRSQVCTLSKPCRLSQPLWFSCEPSSLGACHMLDTMPWTRLAEDVRALPQWSCRLKCFRPLHCVALLILVDRGTGHMVAMRGNECDRGVSKIKLYLYKRTGSNAVLHQIFTIAGVSATMHISAS